MSIPEGETSGQHRWWKPWSLPFETFTFWNHLKLWCCYIATISLAAGGPPLPPDGTVALLPGSWDQRPGWPGTLLPSFLIFSIVVKGNLIISSFFGLIVFEFDHNRAQDKQWRLCLRASQHFILPVYICTIFVSYLYLVCLFIFVCSYLYLISCSYLSQGFTALHLACWRGGVRVVRRLLISPGSFYTLHSAGFVWWMDGFGLIWMALVWFGGRFEVTDKNCVYFIC